MNDHIKGVGLSSGGDDKAAVYAELASQIDGLLAGETTPSPIWRMRRRRYIMPCPR
jgi:hypothetical protein